MENNVHIARTQPEYPKFPYEERDHPMYRSLRNLFKAWGKGGGVPAI
jgi:hypothetical protein